MKSVAVIGHVCKDVVGDDFMPGSGVFYGCCAFFSLGQTYNILTKHNEQDAKYFQTLKDNPHCQQMIVTNEKFPTTTFQNSYIEGKSDQRVSIVKDRSALFIEDDLKLLPKNDEGVAIVTPLIGEFPPELFQKLVELGYQTIVTDVQGFTRKLSPEGTVMQGDWEEKEKFLPLITVLKIDNKESMVLFGTPDLRKGSVELLKRGVKIVVATSAEGVLFSSYPESSQPFSEEKCVFEWREWKQPKTAECRTGRGDTTLFSFVHFFLLRKLPFATACTLTASITEAKMQVMGPLTPSVVEDVKKITSW
ncbi:putative carbohydrtae kinase [Monocercomonoides exilis]|uniref:putative carbohydrtae kinase n=1 Tax=Monocercomonoides exilis TaxID=2049356 RepID=UPI003559674D|nr:putative carbohydrtae kinase [Monocercomonoides exilis]|eukprot:MONOS_11404.1-p1 / transcript=MONOS_11404.1 / gene=MONOS_11404 / organism=Monocercomonoides_exilis_PA203 / gene_product=carbohydrtae kinase / transcript_product=carbohydrtae kinase / location=Mono_scaffold00570:867-2010(+) / protein_length=306 / sequence_SO=supercontig / SO=protein_coding / is_pseudo=false